MPLWRLPLPRFSCATPLGYQDARSHRQENPPGPVYEAARETPISPAPLLSRRFHNQILIKREDLQPVHSFKIRGAYNRMAQLTDEQKAKGVIAASAGNHAQGLAMAAKQMGVKAVIVMPRITPDIKVQAVRGWGARWSSRAMPSPPPPLMLRN